MDTKLEEKKKRYKKALNLLLKIFKDLEEPEKSFARPLIERAAYMKIELEDMEEKLAEVGFVEMFQQTDKIEPYERERPLAKAFFAMSKNYYILKKDLKAYFKIKNNEPQQDDGFDEFRNLK